MEMRYLKETEYEESLKLSMYAFQYDVPQGDIAQRIEKLKNHKVIGVWDDNQLAAKLHILPLKINIGETVWEMGGIAGVATYPEYRRMGLVKDLIKQALKQMRDDNQIVSFLHPFDISFYRKYGWEIMSDLKKVEIDKQFLVNKEKSNGYIKRFNKDTHISDIEDVYQKYSVRYSGLLKRDIQWWLDHVYSDFSIALYYNVKKEAKGYILYKVKNNVMNVEEIVYLDHDARVGLWNFICQHDSMVDKVKITLSVHDLILFPLKQPAVKAEVSPYFMGRIVDVEKALLNYPFNMTEQPIMIHLADTYAQWNEGTYILNGDKLQFFKADKQGSQCVHPPKRGIHMDITALTAILLGYKRPNDLYELGMIMGNEDEINNLEHAVPMHKSHFYDFF